ncbi:MAG: hypothetical protein C4525_15520 [Desulfarculus sp.]|nr:MAG: hypothetical protein C4525_15520 [Desulfarculus sp.]
MSGKARELLRWSLVAGAGYFLFTACSPLIGLRLPMAFSGQISEPLAHQGALLSLINLAWALALLAALASLRHPTQPVLRCVLLGGAAAVVAMSLGNVALAAGPAAPGLDLAGQWPPLALLAAYMGWLSYLRRRLLPLPARRG